MIKIAMYNNKGGVGKSTSTINIAGCLSMRGYRVLIVEIDSQLNCSSVILGQDKVYEITDGNFTDLHNVLEGDPIFHSIISTTFYTKPTRLLRKQEECRIDILPAYKEIATFDISDAYCLKKSLAQAEREYDFCLIDMPPARGSETIIGLVASDYVLTPVYPASFSLGAFGEIIDIVDDIRDSGLNINLKLLGMFLNCYAKGEALHRQIYESLITDNNDLIFSQTIRRATLIPISQADEKPLCFFNPTAPVTKDYEELTDEILRRVGINNAI